MHEFSTYDSSSICFEIVVPPPPLFLSFFFLLSLGEREENIESTLSPEWIDRVSKGREKRGMKEELVIADFCAQSQTVPRRFI